MCPSLSSAASSDNCPGGRWARGTGTRWSSGGALTFRQGGEECEDRGGHQLLPPPRKPCGKDDTSSGQLTALSGDAVTSGNRVRSCLPPPVPEVRPVGWSGRQDTCANSTPTEPKESVLNHCLEESLPPTRAPILDII